MMYIALASVMFYSSQINQLKRSKVVDTTTIKILETQIESLNKEINKEKMFLDRRAKL